MRKVLTDQQQPPAVRRFGLPHILLIFGLSILLCAEAYSGYRLHELSSQRKEVKEDYSAINNITFGIFSVDQWRDKIAAVVNAQVHDFSMTPAQKKALQAQVEQALNNLVDKAVATVNRPQHTIGGKLKKLAFNSFVDTKQIHAQVPSFARTIVNKVSSPASQNRLKDIATGKLNQLEKETYDSTATASDTLTSVLYRKYHVSNTDEFNHALNTRIDAIRTVSFDYLYVMLGCILIVLGIWWLLWRQAHLTATLYVMSLLFAFILAIVGTATSIIEVDARIKTFSFAMMGQKVGFENQVLFFQSKSIAGIVLTLLHQPKADAILVGILILVFIIVFPVLRLIFTGVHLLSKKKFAENKVVRYFAFQSGKWSMADVMIVGILMTYIGLNGILQSQLSNLNIHNSFLTAVTENNTSLQSGYYVFTAFVIYSLGLTTIIKKITPYDAS